MISPSGSDLARRTPSFKRRFISRRLISPSTYSTRHLRPACQCRKVWPSAIAIAAARPNIVLPSPVGPARIPRHVVDSIAQEADPVLASLVQAIPQE